MTKYTGEELLNLPSGTPVITIIDYVSFKTGDTIYRKHDENDDDISVIFSTNPDGTGYNHFMNAGEVVAVDKTQAFEYTPDQLLELPTGTAVKVRLGTLCFSAGDVVYRKESGLDDRSSVCFSTNPDGHGLVEYLPSNRVEGLTKAEPPLTGDLDSVEKVGMYRPDLTTRKADKVRVELVDDGFPLALRELAKVMTWAQKVKGYKDHDWQNLPNAEIALAAAASRHRTDYIKQRVVEGHPANMCTDHESDISHKAHEAFGVLAQLELLLRGEFDK